MALEKLSPCKVNLLLNILRKRTDGFHELESVMHPVRLYDRLILTRRGQGIHLSCTEPSLPTDGRNLVYRAAAAFIETARVRDGVDIHLEKRIPMAAGLGGGSGNAATALLGLNQLFGEPLSDAALHSIAASLGSDVPFFLQDKPALATGRGEKIQSLEPFRALKGAAFILVHPGFGVSTPWAYQRLAEFPEALNGRIGRAQEFLKVLQTQDLNAAAAGLYNSLEAPVLKKYPLLALFQEFFRANGAAGALMSGSGSTTFALVTQVPEAEALAGKFKAHFGTTNWVAVLPV